MMQWDKKISLCFEKMEKDIPICSLRSINEYIQYAKKQDLNARYFPVLDCGFIVYKDTTIFLISEAGGTILSLNPMSE